MPASAQDQNFRLLTFREVCRIVGLSRATVYKRIQNGTFPPPIHIAPRVPRWRSDAFQAWIDGLTEPRAA